MSAAQRGPRGMTAFVPNGDSRQDTAILLLGAALDSGMDETRVVAAAPGGFYISDELADALSQPEPEPTPVVPPKAKATTKKTSGNRAVEKNSEEE